MIVIDTTLRSIDFILIIIVNKRYENCYNN